MILKWIMNISIEIFTYLISIVSATLPEIDFVRYIKVFMDIIADTLQTSINFVYFILGESMYPILSIAIFLFTYDNIIFPVAVVIRRIFIKGGDT